jgi:acyl-CoA thioesterase-1
MGRDPILKNPLEAGSAEEKAAGLPWAFTPNPRLPNVLIIGDSISMGYTLKVRKILLDQANIYRPLAEGGKEPLNCGDTKTGMKFLNQWLGTNHWDVIHFNFGLHDLKYLDERGNYVSPDQGKQVTPPVLYETNLRVLVAELKKTGASLIWCSTTPIPEGAAGRVKGDEIVYNRIAEKVMKENGIAMNDLWSIVAPKQNELQIRKNVHFTDKGSDILAEAVAQVIKTRLIKATPGQRVLCFGDSITEGGNWVASVGKMVCQPGTNDPER